MLNGKIFIISAPSGAGKSSLIKKLINDNPKFKISISYTTRKARLGEKNGQHYYFISKNKFKFMIKKNNFIEYAKVFGNYYGTTKKNIMSFLSEHHDVFLDIDWQGAKQIKKIFPNITKSIFVLPPSKNELFHRLLKRARDSHYIIKKRMKQAIEEMNHHIEYDYLIINDDFNTAILDLKTIIYAEKLNILYQKNKYKDLINELTKD